MKERLTDREIEREKCEFSGSTWLDKNVFVYLRFPYAILFASSKSSSKWLPVRRRRRRRSKKRIKSIHNNILYDLANNQSPSYSI